MAGAVLAWILDKKAGARALPLPRAQPTTRAPLADRAGTLLAMQAVPGPEPALELELEHEPEPEPELGPERPLVQPLSARGVWPAFRSGAYLRDPVTGHGPATLAFGLSLAAPLPAGVTKQRHGQPQDNPTRQSEIPSRN